MAKSKGVKKTLDSYSVKGTHKVVKGEQKIRDSVQSVLGDT